MPMVMRTVDAGQTCTLRILRKGTSPCKYDWIVITVVEIVRARYMVYTIADKNTVNPTPWTVYLLSDNLHEWTVQGRVENVTITLHQKKGRGYNSKPQVGIMADSRIGIQWDEFEGSLRTGQ